MHLLPEIYDFSLQRISSDDYDQPLEGKFCFNDFGFIGPLFFENQTHPSLDIPFTFVDQNLKYSSLVDSDPLTFRMMDGVPDGEYLDSYAVLVFRPGCTELSLDISVEGLIETSSAKDKLWIWADHISEARQFFDRIEYINENEECDGETIVYNPGPDTILGDLMEIEGQGSRWLCERDGSPDQGSRVYAEMSIPVTEGPCPKVVIFRANTQDAFNNVDGDIFYEITINIS